MADIFSTPAPSTQISQSLDNVEDVYYQLAGASSDADPWLLRHCRFDDFGSLRLFRVQIRNAGGVPTRDKIPAHFLVGDRDVYDSARLEAGVAHDGDLREELASLVPPDIGLRILRLFMKHVFPLLPIISRSRLGLDKLDDAAPAQILNRISTPLLAAIYGSALPFASEDSYVFLATSHSKAPLAQIWSIVHKSVVRGIHSPRLYLVQAALLYIHRPVQEEHSYAITDAASMWSIIGLTVGMAHSLGLNLECRSFGMPDEEKRVRRRVWWALYCEDKWASLLFGRPPYIRSSEWDVSELEDADFYSTFLPDHGTVDLQQPFREMARLAVIAESVQDKLYSLRASQRLAVDLSASLAVAKPLLDTLGGWRASLPTNSSQTAQHGDTSQSQTHLPATIHNAYWILLVYVWRALLRATVRSSDPPVVIHMQEPSDSGYLAEDMHWRFDYLPEMDVRVEEDANDNSHIVRELHEAALTCASNVLDFLSGLDYSAFNGFWHSWSRKGFASISSFLLSLLIQAPDFPKAIKAKALLDKWQQLLRQRHKSFPFFSQGKVRLDSLSWSGLGGAFNLATHVQQALQHTG
ncbi:hypothetical protein JDV02_002046 [Purpureocillium takamizusanense]|uniref:Xylanolytic transcriptional activator regulatory domain-containing protein n=1 Tax=Purpureocillium takamizusanense TaxID=2060973 RepID=A0A9Q8Q7Z4_9HYPO|nr:uncharacterized protein JDV02_002046 [Purpureocillium takamizusanense]UNI15519.1 hypothetical protein JDV02_002046 [Purpureocillium takamizusanense]